MIEPSIDREAHVVRFERALRATADCVFDAWTRPEQIALWWDPAGAPLAECEIDLRIDGAIRFVNRAGPAFEGRYLAIERPHRLVFEAMGAVGTVEIDPQETGCVLRVAIKGASAKHFEQLLEMGIDQGTGRTLGNLVRFVDEDNA